MNASRPVRWLTAAFAAAVLALASQLALAHGAHHHEAESVSPADEPALVAYGETIAATHAVPAAWSGSCPDGSGGDCCCQHRPVTPGAAKFAIVNAGGWSRLASLQAARPAIPLTKALPRQFHVSRAHPRAPPYFS